MNSHKKKNEKKKSILVHLVDGTTAMGFSLDFLKKLSEGCSSSLNTDQER